MSALAEALVAAQRRAIKQLEKVYVAGGFEDDRMREQLDAIGCADAVDQDHLIAALDTIRAYGGPLPQEARLDGGASAEPRQEPKATEAQLARIRRDLQSHNFPVFAEQDAANLTKTQASNIIEAIAGGTYDPTVYDVPF